MACKEEQVGIADYKVTRDPGRLITLGLGSCVGVSLYDPVTKIGGLIHIMLPDSTQFNRVPKPAKFADLGIPLLIEEVVRHGARQRNLEAKMAGGAQMFSANDERLVLNIGQRNSEMARQMLHKFGIRIVAEDVGGHNGRTMIFDSANGQVTVRMLGSQVKVI